MSTIVVLAMGIRHQPLLALLHPPRWRMRMVDEPSPTETCLSFVPRRIQFGLGFELKI